MLDSLSMSVQGDTLCFYHDGKCTLFRLRQNTARVLEQPGLIEALAFSDQVWLLCDEGGLLVRRVGTTGIPFEETPNLDGFGRDLVVRRAPFGSPAIIIQDRSILEIRDDCGNLAQVDIEEDADVILPISPRVWVAIGNGQIWLRRPEFRKTLQSPTGLPWEDIEWVEGYPLYDGTGMVLALGSQSGALLLLYDLRHGTLLKQLHLEGVRLVQVTHNRGHAVVVSGERSIAIIDIPSGQCLKEWSEEQPIRGLAVDKDGNAVVLWLGGTNEPEALVATSYTHIFGASETAPGTSRPKREDLLALVKDMATVPNCESGRAEKPASPIELTDAEYQRLAETALVGLQPRAPAKALEGEALAENLEACLALIAGWCRRAIAAGWDSGRLSNSTAGAFPFEGEVAAILEAKRGRAPQQLTLAMRAAEAAERMYRARADAMAIPADTGHACVLSPLLLMAREFELSLLAADILLVVAAPMLWGELARMYGIIGNDPSRPLCDELLIGQILGPCRASRREIAEELGPGRPLVRYGLIRVGQGMRPFAALTVPQVVVDRLWGKALEQLDSDGPIRCRRADRKLSELLVPEHMLYDLVQSLGRYPENRPARLVLRGRAGSGRRTLLAALAEQAGRILGEVQVTTQLRDRRVGPETLKSILNEAVLRRLLPCLSETERLAEGDPLLGSQLRDVFRSHPGPIVFRCEAACLPPLDSDFLCFDLPPLGETRRLRAWERSLEQHQLPIDLAADMAARFQLGPGAIERVCHSVDSGPAASTTTGDIRARLETAVRQQRQSRIAATATRVERLASWSSVVLPSEIVDSLREFIGRIRHRRTVFERWGFDRIATSARGMTALFQGGPGTGKSMVAGLIARELGYELYRIDLSRVLSKWIGETEKNLGQVFDAAEEGEVVLLFDEADSLFARRTEVKSSVDRYANIEVNYLLQRFDSFEGIAILTTNFGTALDNAFKRRLSLRLQFPFPDERMRERLWRVHLPPEVPREGDLDLRMLAERYEMSGGYIRNAALRAAFLAAQEDRPLRQEHLERAVRLEYREMGKLTESGLLE